MGRIVSVHHPRMSPSLGSRSDKVWIAKAVATGQPADLARRVAGAPLAVSAGMILTTVLTVVFVGISSLMLWLAIGAD
jgi:hypothetical protein